jgi:hypothetical protein
MTEETRSKEFINNSKIERYVRLNTFVDLLEDSINKKQAKKGINRGKLRVLLSRGCL